MEDLQKLIDQIKKNTAAQEEQNRKWRQERGLPEREPTELELLLQRWEQAGAAPLFPAPKGEAPLSPEQDKEEPLSEPPAEIKGEEAIEGASTTTTPASQSSAAEGCPLSRQRGHLAGMPGPPST
ncbi:UNVERIFIED_CONTAM: hypothetical protein FKN15_056961 [Acipenser sinensis]